MRQELYSTFHAVFSGLTAALTLFSLQAAASDLQVHGSTVNTGNQAARLTVGACVAGDAVVPDGPLSADPGVEPCGKLIANDVDVVGGSAVHFRAGTSIELGSGFSVDAATRFTAEIGATTAGPAFVRDENPAAVGDYYARFYVNPDNLALDADSDQFDHFIAYDASGNKEFLIGVTYESGAAQRRMFVTAFEDNGTARTTKDLCEPVLGTGWQYVEAHWKASTGTDGDVELSVNGGAAISLADCLSLAGGLDNDTGEISAAEWGARDASPGYLGAMGLDDFDARDGAILSSNPDRLQPASAVNNNQSIGFGSAVALDGNVLVVGSPGEDHSTAAGVNDTGAVRVFERQGGSWVETDKLRAPTETAGENFGYSVDVALGDDGTDYLIVGSPLFTGGGRAHLFKRNGDGPWLHEVAVTQEVPDAGDRFGEAVAIDYFQPPNDPNATGPVFVAAVTSPGNKEEPSGSQNGSVSIFQRSGGPPTWGRTHEFFGAFADGLGKSVAMGGPNIIVGGEGLDGAGVNAGGALLYSQGNLVVTVYNYAGGIELKPSDPQPAGASGMGLAAALDNDPASPGIAVIGAPLHDGGNFNTGKVYIYSLLGSNFPEEEASLQVPGTPAQATFGTSVDLSGAILAVGAPGFPLGSDGTVFLYEKGATEATWSPAGTLTIPNLPPAGTCRGGDEVAVQGLLVAVGCPTSSNADDESVFMYFGDAIFSDGFESGDTSAWTSSMP